MTTVAQDNSYSNQGAVPAPATDAKTRAAGTVIDPVCGMTVTPNAATPTDAFGGDTFHFCSKGCLAKFQIDPWFYASGRATSRKRAAPADVC